MARPLPEVVGRNFRREGANILQPLPGHGEGRPDKVVLHLTESLPSHHGHLIDYDILGARE